MKRQVLGFLLLLSSAAGAQPIDCAVTAIQRRTGMPQVLVEKQGTLYSLAHRGDSVLENTQLGLQINMPKGIRAEETERFLASAMIDAGLRVGHMTFIRIVYFDYNSDLIRNDASAELDKLADVLTVYRFAQVVVFVHTDSRGSNEFNNKLAARRGKSIENYLKQAGVDTRNMTIKVSGEAELITDCPDKASCDEMLHQANRRAEFVLNPIVK